MANSTPGPEALGLLITKNTASIASYKNDLLSKTKASTHGWLAYLGMAPLCLELLALCSLTAARDDAQGVVLVTNKNYKYLKGHLYLSTCLIEVGNMGRICFQSCYREMELVRQSSEYVKETVTMIVRSLLRGDINLKRQLEVLMRAANDCKEATEKMDTALENWSSYVMELHEACDATDQDAKSKYENALSNEKSRKIEEDAVKKAIATATQWVKEREDLVSEMKEMVQEEMKKYPTGNQLMVMDLVQTLGNATASAVNLLAGAAASRFGGGAAFNNNNNHSSEMSSSNNADKDDDGESADNVANDPAAAHVPFTTLSLTQLYGLVSDKVTGVKWDYVTNLESISEGGQLDLPGVESSLKTRRAFLERKKVTKNSTVGKALLKAIDDADLVVSELNVERAKSRNMNQNWKKPAKDSNQVKEWQSKVKKAKKKVQELEVKAKGLTSGTKNPPVPGANLQAAAASGSKTASQMAVEAASFKVSTARQLYKNSLDSADTARAQLLSFQNQLGTVKADLDALKEEKLTLEAVKLCLRNCLTLMVELKDCIAQLRLFFEQMTIQIATMVKGKVIPFHDTVQDKIASPDALINRMILQQYTVAIWAGFDQFKEIAEFYKSVHDPWILRGLKVVDDMTLQKNVTAGYNIIQKYAEESQAAVRDLLGKETDRFMNKIQKSFNEIVELEKHALPPSEDEKILLAKAGESVVTVVKEQLDAKSAPIQFLLKPREERDKQAEKLINALNPHTTHQQNGFYENDDKTYLGMDDD